MLIGTLVGLVGGGTGESLIASAVKGLDKAILKLEKAETLLAEEKVRHDEEIAERMRRLGEVEKARQRARRISSKFRELMD